MKSKNLKFTSNSLSAILLWSINNSGHNWLVALRRSWLKSTMFLWICLRQAMTIKQVSARWILLVIDSFRTCFRYLKFKDDFNLQLWTLRKLFTTAQQQSLFNSRWSAYNISNSLRPLNIETTECNKSQKCVVESSHLFPCLTVLSNSFRHIIDL